jgi:hypothetical protein
MKKGPAAIVPSLFPVSIDIANFCLLDQLSFNRVKSSETLQRNVDLNIQFSNLTPFPAIVNFAYAQNKWS